MTMAKRAVYYLLRNCKKTALIFTLIFILGVIGSGAFSIYQTVHHTKDSLISQVPAIASIRPTLGGGNTALTLETIREIGGLPHVKSYVYEIGHMFYSTELQRYINSQPDESWNVRPQDITDWWGISHRIEDGHLDRFQATGVSTGNLALETELIRIVSGRNFEETELKQGIPVVLVSEGFARTNGLEVGSAFTVNNLLYDNYIHMHLDGGGERIFAFDGILESVLVNQPLEVTVIGIFEVLQFMDIDYLWQNIFATQGLLNSIFMPSTIVEEARSFINAQGNELIPGFWEQGDGTRTAFLLDDPRNLSAFLTSANQDIFDDDWMMDDLSGNIGPVMSVLEMKEMFASSILYGAVLVAVVVLALLVNLSF
ncbi:MAG: hypothetical protein FWF59_03460 [Turicibacter sp.]|nr:hypothetical protein [Turicibacter sp.]